MSIVFMDTQKSATSWQPPKFEVSATHCLGYVEEQIQEGEGYLEGSKSYKNLAQNMRIFDGIYADRTRSTLQTNFLKYCIRKFVETISDVREIGILRSDAVQYKQYAEIETNVMKCVYSESQFPRQLRKVLQWASVTGQAYMWPKMKAQDYGFGERRIVFEPLGILDVLPVQVPKTNDVQDAYLNTIYDYMPIAEAHAKFPLFQSQLVPVNYCTQPSRLTAKRLDWAEKFRYGDQTRNWGNLYVEIRYTFIRDLRVNTSGFEFPMGDEGTSWFYKVPGIGQPIFGGVRNGQPFMRAAELQDCRVYPNLRLIITSPSVKNPMYDGPAFDWHGKMPAIQYTVDDWPWEALGLSLVESVGAIEQTKRKHERGMDQVISTRMNPPMGYDRTSVGGPKVENFDLFEPNQRMGGDGPPRQTFQSLLPDDVQITDTNYKFQEMLKAMIKEQLGIDDLGNLMDAKLNLSPDSFDKALETIGPIAKGIATTMEAGNDKVAEMMKFLIPQYMDVARIIEYIGPDKITSEIYDFDPCSLIPSHGDDEYRPDGLLPFTVVEGVNVYTASQYDKLTRARNFAKKLRLISAPSTLLKITQQSEQLKFLQLFRGDFPISPHTVAKKLGIENYGDIPGDTEFEKWVNWKKIQLGLLAQEQQLAAQLGLGQPGMDPASGDQGDEPSNGATGKPEGRPPSGQQPPKIVQKGKHDGKPRTTVTESK